MLSVAQMAQPLRDCLDANYPLLSEEARIAFAVQIALANAGEGPANDLRHLGGSISPG